MKDSNKDFLLGIAVGIPFLTIPWIIMDVVSSLLSMRDGIIVWYWVIWAISLALVYAVTKRNVLVVGMFLAPVVGWVLLMLMAAVICGPNFM